MYLSSTEFNRNFFIWTFFAAISPGIIETDLVKKMIAVEGRSAINKSVPLKKIGNASNIADTALFLASSQSEYMTGQVLNVNGGLFLG